jgi:hypothetical protein
MPNYNVASQEIRPAWHGNGQEDEDELELLIRRVDTPPTGSEVRGVASL